MANVVLVHFSAPDRRQFFLTALLSSCLAFGILLLCVGCSPPDDQKKQPSSTTTTTVTVAQRPKILLVNSYHYQFPWTRGITASIADYFQVMLDQQGMVLSTEQGTVELKIIYMDSKRNADETSVTTAAFQARQTIETWRPDLLIISDDNAARYLVAPHLVGSALPVVFCGINWSADEYGFPADNVTGMIEVQLIGQLLNSLRPYAKGDRIAFLKGDDASARKEAAYFEQSIGRTLDKRFVGSFPQWKQEYLRLQQECDMLLIGNAAALGDWDAEAARQLIHEKTRVPTGNWDTWMASYALISLATMPEEQGQWAAQTALRILEGAAPASVPIAFNKSATMYLNMRLAKRLGITFPMQMIDQAMLVE